VLREDRIVRLLAEKLRVRNKRLGERHEQHLGQVLTRVTPAKSSKVYALLKEIYGGLSPPLQPDIDILLRKNDDIRAVEVKVFHLEAGNRLSRSYYEGIDQALALLMFGFNKVALWHIFDKDIELEKLARYGSSAQLFIREQLRLPLDFTAMYLTKENGDYDFVPTQPRISDFRTMELVETRVLKKIDDPSFPFVWKSTNPLLTYPLVTNICKVMLEWLSTRRE
jgi:hypothetical protein